MKIVKAALNGYASCGVALLTLLSLSFFSTNTLVSAQEKSPFSCKNKQGIWTTVVESKQGEKNFIHWDSTYFVTSGYTPEKRCHQVTGRLNAYSNSTSEQYIASGRMNNQPIICIAGSRGGSCEKLLYTLKPGQDGEIAVDLLVKQTESNFNSPSLRESPCRTYLSLNRLLEGKPLAHKICS